MCSVARALANAQAFGLARIDAQMLLLHSLGRETYDRAWLIAHDTEALSTETQEHYLGLCARRAAGEPLAYVIGRREFYGLPLAVDARVLDPRPDTETLVNWALELAPHLPLPLGVVDLGTGSGAIALALQHRLPDAQVLAVDASFAALQVAQSNTKHLDLPVCLAQTNWLHGLAPGWSLIVSNPPYIAADDPHLAVLQHEPLSALVSGSDGLQDIRNIAIQAPAHLTAGGWLLLEHGWNQADAVQTLLRQAGFAQVQSRFDLAGIARCTGGRME